MTYYVYCIGSKSPPGKRYVGFTENLKQRLADHNKGRNRSSSDFCPWRLKGYIAFDSKERALTFERYLKSGSGRAFAKRRLW